MSIKFCLPLVLLLCLCLHACSARKLGPLNDKKHEKKLYASSNNQNDDEKKGFDYKTSAPSKMETFTSNDDDGVEATKEGENTHEEIIMKKSYSKAKHRLLKDHDDDHEKGISSSSIRASSVTWRVPHQRNKDQLPGFNVDYSPPKTHPPSHN